MAMSVKIITFFLLTTVLSVSCLKCFRCESSTDRSCDEDPGLSAEDVDYIVECNGTCKKSQFKDGNQAASIRLCDNNVHNTSCYEENIGDGYEIAICYCNEDLCNGSDVTKSLQMIPLAFCAVGVLIAIYSSLT